ncbi:DNA-binding transcription factor [Lithospermum erythrorhizon]|uniref:DNA-binding transcription factor n=1 Tax=Lithospermum erythrorhizon TaxID=34254 RepID=A0AAV3S0Q7_LITER
MASMNNWLGFSLSSQQNQHVSTTDVSGECFDLTATTTTNSDSSTTVPSLNLPAPLGILEAFNRNTQSQDWNIGNDSNYKASSDMTSILENQEPKLENFLGFSSSTHQEENNKLLQGCNNNSTIGLSMIKNWLRNNPNSTLQQPLVENQCDSQTSHGANNNNTNNELSLSMGTENNNGADVIVSESRQQIGTSLDSQTGAIEAVPRKSIDTFGQRTSIYRGVTRHRWTGRYEAHLWDNSCRREGQTRKGRQGGYDKEEKAARAYDLAALKYWGTSTTTNFPISEYEKEIEDMKNMTRQEFVASLRRKSSGFSRGASIYRGVTRHHQHGRWQARIGRVAGNKDLYLGTFSTQEEAAEAYDIAAIKFRGLNAVTNFEISRYDVKSILESANLPIGGTAKRLKDAEQAEMALQNLQRSNLDASIALGSSSHLPEGLLLNNYGTTPHHVWPSIAFHQQAQPLNSTMHFGGGYNANHQQRFWCKQEQENIHQNDYLQQPSHHHVLHNLMSLDSSSSMEQHNSGSNSFYDAYGGGNGYMLPMATVIAGPEVGSQGDHTVAVNNGYGDSNEVKSLGYENNMYGNFYCHSQQQSSGGNTWVPTAVPNLAARTGNMASVCHGGAQTFTVWDET